MTRAASLCGVLRATVSKIMSAYHHEGRTREELCKWKHPERHVWVLPGTSLLNSLLQYHRSSCHLKQHLPAITCLPPPPALSLVTSKVSSFEGVFPCHYCFWLAYWGLWVRIMYNTSSRCNAVKTVYTNKIELN